MSLEWLLARPSTDVRWGLERTAALLAEVGDPHHTFRSVHVGGTNGKGSVSTFIASVLQRHPAASPVGLYTSPHLVSFNERVQIGGHPAEDDLVERAALRLRPAIERSGATFFEATTAVAFLCFAEAGVRTAVIEVGMGGRLDATNVVRPEVAVVTNIAMDHAEHLGATLPEIAAEKGGIFKPGVRAITAESNHEISLHLRGRAAIVGAPFHHLDERATLLHAALSEHGTEVHLRSTHWGESQLILGMAGVHQACNAVLAAEAIALLPSDLVPALEVVVSGLEGAAIPGRLQRVRRGTTTWLFDVAHNIAGAEALGEALPAMHLPSPIVVIAGILADKEWEGMLRTILPACDGAILTVPGSAPTGRRWNAEQVAKVIGDRFPARVIPDLGAALRRAETMAPHGTVLVTGSVHTVGDALAALGIDPFPPGEVAATSPALDQTLS